MKRIRNEKEETKTRKEKQNKVLWNGFTGDRNHQSLKEEKKVVVNQINR